MKADRLISILMLLQIHKELTANELAQRLEVSIRTIYRDIDSLSGMGIPIFSNRGAKGGIKLLGDYKTSLNGLNNDEIYSLFIPTSDKILDDLGIQKLKDSTLLKIFGNSAPNQINEIKNIQNYIYVDMNTWSDKPTNVNKDILSLLQNAIWNHKVLKIIYRKIDGSKNVTLNPLGLVCKRGIWYLIGINHEVIKTYKVSSIEYALLQDETFTRPSNFSLENHWKSSTTNFKNLIPKYKFTFKINTSILNHIEERRFVTISNKVVKDNELYLDINFDDIWQGIEFAFSYGKDLEIIKPLEAIKEIRRKANDIISLYND